MLSLKRTEDLDAVELLDCASTVPPKLLPEDTRRALLARDFVAFFFGLERGPTATTLTPAIIDHIQDYKTTVGIDLSNRARKAPARKRLFT